MKRIKLTTAIGILIIPVVLLAQSGRAVYDEANKMGAEADKRLNAAYQQLISSLRTEDEPDLTIERLRESQRAWLKYREAQVAFVGTHGHIGSSSARAEGMASYSVELTEQRIKDLKDVPNPF